jgi:hypothetical protein
MLLVDVIIRKRETSEEDNIPAERDLSVQSIDRSFDYFSRTIRFVWVTSPALS